MRQTPAPESGNRVQTLVPEKLPVPADPCRIVRQPDRAGEKDREEGVPEKDKPV